MCEDDATTQLIATQATIDRLTFELRRLVQYANWQMNEGPGHHPTLPSAVASARALLVELNADKPAAMKAETDCFYVFNGCAHPQFCTDGCAAKPSGKCAGENVDG